MPSTAAAVRRLPAVRAESRTAFDDRLAAEGLGPLRAGAVTTLQVNLGKRCNQACRHCHVDAGPNRKEAMAWTTARQVLRLLAASPSVDTVDVTGGAPELNPGFRVLVARARALGRHVIDRNNLTVLGEPGQEDLPEFLAGHGVEVIASLPCYTADNVDHQRGAGVFGSSIASLRRLNAAGYGLRGSPLALSLVYNPGGPFLPPDQAALEARYRKELRDGFGIEFHHLFVLANMPIRRFADDLARQGRLAAYQDLLSARFNPATVPALMCRSLVSVSWDGGLYDCDFNQMLDVRLSSPLTVWDVDDLGALAGRSVATGTHCFGCTAGSGSSCGGALA